MSIYTAMPCTAADLGNIKIRNGPYPQEVFSLVNLSPLSSSLPHLPGQFGVYPSFLPHTLEVVLVILIYVASFSFPVVVGICFIWCKYICMSEIGARHWMSSSGLHIPTGTRLDSIDHGITERKASQGRG